MEGRVDEGSDKVGEKTRRYGWERQRGRDKAVRPGKTGGNTTQEEVAKTGERWGRQRGRDRRREAERNTEGETQKT